MSADQSMLEKMQELMAQFQAQAATVAPVAEKSPKEQRMLEHMHRFILATQLQDATVSYAVGAEIALEHLQALFDEMRGGA